MEGTSFLYKKNNSTLLLVKKQAIIKKKARYLPEFCLDAKENIFSIQERSIMRIYVDT